MIKLIPALIISSLMMSCGYSESLSDDFAYEDDKNITSPYGDNNQFFSVSSLVKDVFFAFQNSTDSEIHSVFDCGNINLYIFESSRLVNTSKKNTAVLIVSISGKTVIVDSDTTESEFVTDIIDILKDILCECNESADICMLNDQDAIENVFSACDLSFEITEDRVWYP